MRPLSSAPFALAGLLALAAVPAAAESAVSHADIVRAKAQVAQLADAGLRAQAENELFVAEAALGDANGSSAYASIQRALSHARTADMSPTTAAKPASAVHGPQVALSPQGDVLRD